MQQIKNELIWNIQIQIQSLFNTLHKKTQLKYKYKQTDIRRYI